MPAYVPVTVTAPVNPLLPFASALELGDFLGFTPANADQLLKRASRRIRRATMTAVYEVNAQGLPTSPECVAAFREATCEEIASMLEDGDKKGSGSLSVGAGFSIGRLKVDKRDTGAHGIGTSRTARLSDSAWQVLWDAGLTGQEPQAP